MTVKKGSNYVITSTVNFDTYEALSDMEATLADILAEKKGDYRMNMVKWRAVQIDLARQIETLPTVFRYFDNAKQAGMNMIVLYLEDRIKTPTYPFSTDDESYSPEQIRQMVAYADKLGLEVVPVVSPIGHTERFLRHPELQHLAELHDGCEGRFHDRLDSTCATLPETHEFFGAYIGEVAALFPSKFFHVGFDEIFDLGLCARCREEITDKEGIGALYIQLVLRYYELLKGLGKTMLIWDDMLEWFPEAINAFPKDIILFPWWYEHIARFPEGRFWNDTQEDMLTWFEEKGFNYFVCTRDSVVSLDSLTAYAKKHQPMGLLVTSWENSTKQIKLFEPIVRYAGLLWNEGLPSGVETLQRAMLPFAGNEESAAVLAQLATLQISALSVPKKGAGLQLLPWKATERESAAALLEKALQTGTFADEDCRDVFLSDVYRFRLTYRLHKLALALHEHRTGEIVQDADTLKAQLLECRKRYEQAKALDEDLWKRCRDGFAATDLESFYQSIAESLAWLEETAQTAKPKQSGRLDIKFYLPDYTAAATTCVTLQYADGTEEVGCGRFKSMFVHDVVYDRTFAVPADKVPVALKLSVSGYGAAGFVFADVTLPQGRFVPQTVQTVSGVVDHPEYLLGNDARAALLNEPDLLCGIRDIAKAKEKHELVVALAKKEWK